MVFTAFDVVSVMRAELRSLHQHSSLELICRTFLLSSMRHAAAFQAASIKKHQNSALDATGNWQWSPAVAAEAATALVAAAEAGEASTDASDQFVWQVCLENDC